jgi:hypothetical protein
LPVAITAFVPPHDNFGRRGYGVDHTYVAKICNMVLTLWLSKKLSCEVVLNPVARRNCRLLQAYEVEQGARSTLMKELELI